MCRLTTHQGTGEWVGTSYFPQGVTKEWGMGLAVYFFLGDNWRSGRQVSCQEADVLVQIVLGNELDILDAQGVMPLIYQQMFH